MAWIKFDITVKDFVLMGLLDSLGNLDNNLNSFGDFEPALFFQKIIQRLSFNVFHAEEMKIVSSAMS